MNPVFNVIKWDTFTRQELKELLDEVIKQIKSRKPIAYKCPYCKFIGKPSRSGNWSDEVYNHVMKEHFSSEEDECEDGDDMSEDASNDSRSNPIYD